jgi:hypothetical protein
VTHKDAMSLITEMTGAAVITKGIYVPPGKQPPEGEARLHLLIEGPSELSVKRAKQEIKKILEETTEKVRRGCCCCGCAGCLGRLLGCCWAAAGAVLGLAASVCFSWGSPLLLGQRPGRWRSSAPLAPALNPRRPLPQVMRRDAPAAGGKYSVM